MIQFKMPSLGADMESGILVNWFVKPGDKVSRGDIVAEVETEKGVIEVEVWQTGTVSKLMVEAGNKVPVGEVMALLDDNTKESAKIFEPIQSDSIAEGFSNEGQNQLLQQESEMPSSRSAKNQGNKGKSIRISPLAKKIAKSKGIDISLLKGTGFQGSITKADVEACQPLVRQTPL